MLHVVREVDLRGHETFFELYMVRVNVYTSILFLFICFGLVFSELSFLFENAINDRRECSGAFIDLDTGNMAVPGLWVLWIGWKSG